MEVGSCRPAIGGEAGPRIQVPTMRKSSSRQPPAMRNPFRPANPRLASLVGQRPRLRALAAQSARALLRRSPSRVKRAQGRPGADNAPAVCCAKCTRRKPHSSIQVVPITRPSLRDGRTAYAALSREPNSFWPPSPSRNSPAPRRLTRMPHPPRLGRSNDGQDHTVLPYARFVGATGFDGVVHFAAEMPARRT